jgi:hypothetical protein
MGPRAGVDGFQEEINSLVPSRIRTLDGPARSLITIPITLLQLAVVVLAAAVVPWHLLELTL